LTLLLLSVAIFDLGGFNIHWGCQRNADTKHLADILRSANLRQHVQETTHRHCHILDLVISHDDDNLINGVYLSYCLIISLLTLIYLYRNNLFQLMLFHIENINQLTRRLFLMISECFFFSGIGSTG